MKRLIKRYVLKAQVDRENDEVNEGKIQQIHCNVGFYFTHILIYVHIIHCRPKVWDEKKLKIYFKKKPIWLISAAFI